MEKLEELVELVVTKDGNDSGAEEDSIREAETVNVYMYYYNY